eukprot:SAG22_NODE_817_length_7026_cov_13.636206_2_plen_147_part_00
MIPVGRRAAGSARQPEARPPQHSSDSSRGDGRRNAIELGSDEEKEEEVEMSDEETEDDESEEEADHGDGDATRTLLAQCESVSEGLRKDIRELIPEGSTIESTHESVGTAIGQPPNLGGEELQLKPYQVRRAHSNHCLSFLVRPWC